MEQQPKNRDALELADAYWRDAAEYLLRYRTIFHMPDRDNQGIKSRRVKAYIDLRTATETILKSRFCLRIETDQKRSAILDDLRKLRHNIIELVKASVLTPSNEVAEVLSKCDLAPIFWRYEAESRQAREEDDRHYYATVGSDQWLAKLEEFVDAEVGDMDKRLKAFSRIVSGAQLSAEIFGERSAE
jgi:hypothetical protein